MKRLFVILYIITSIAMIFGHAPAKVDASYDKAKKTVNVNVTHQIKDTKKPDPKVHFIKEIVVNLNGKKITNKTFKSQPTLNGLKTSIAIKVPVKKDDKITVIAKCSVIGMKSTEIVVLK